IVDRNGGYTRIIKTGYRVGDNAEMCLIELVDFNELYSNEAVKKTTRRSRRGGKKSVDSLADSTEVVEESLSSLSEDSAVEATSADDIIAEAEVIEETTTESTETVESSDEVSNSNEEKTDSEEDSNKDS
ncbi:MAG: hypothetical protein RLZ10_314, partial [Bacteroidota bacterium]